MKEIQISQTFGIYQIKQIDTEKLYIGSTSKSFTSRWYQHRKALRIGTHHSKYMQNSWNKYGEDKFEFSVLEVVEAIEGESSEDKKIRVLEREQHYIDTLQPVFNMCPKAGSRLGSKMSDETKTKLAEIRATPEYKEKQSAAKRGRKLTDEHKQKISEGNIGKNLGREMSDDTKAKISAAKIGSPGPMLGRTQSEESRAKMSEAKKGSVPWNRGQTNCYSTETRARWSEVRKGSVPWHKGKSYHNNGYSYYTIGDETKTRKQWLLDPRAQVNVNTLKTRMRKGMTFEEALLTPIKTST